MKLMHGDCLELLPSIESGSIDLILCDLPYGTTQNKWDSVIPLDKLWEEYRRVCRGAIVLTAAQPFTSALVSSAPDLFRYQWVWEKPKASGFLNARRRPLTAHEDILVFGNIETYNPQGLQIVSVNNARKNKSGNGNFGKVSDKPYIQTEGNFPRSVIRFSHETKPQHPTQKPVLLMEYLIKTYTNEGGTVLDNTMGSGTTGVACINTRRKFIGIERDIMFFTLARNRIVSHSGPELFGSNDPL